MPRCNRVTPDGSIIAHAGRGLLMGNRGCLHDREGHIVRAPTTRAWIACELVYRGRRRPLMAPGRYTELFFLDEAVALAAGHRPCALCRRSDFARFAALWSATHGGPPRAGTLDDGLAAARGRSPETGIGGLPDGAFVRRAGERAPMLVLGDSLLPFDPAGYGPPQPRRANDTGQLLTPLPVVALLAAGYRPRLHPSAARPDRP